MSAGSDAALVAALFAVDPAGVGGVCVRSQPQPARDEWLRVLREVLPRDTAVRRVPCNISDDRLLGGLDLVATLKANRPVAERGVLASSDGGVLVISMAERLSSHTAACLGTVLDTGEVMLPREGVYLRHPARIGIVALDESIAADESVAASLLDRLAFVVDLGGFDLRTPLFALHEREDIVDAREALPRIATDSAIVESLCAAALALGIGSPRISLLACRAARIAAALAGRTRIAQEDAVVAARLVLAPRATRISAAQAAPAEESAPVGASAQANEPAQAMQSAPAEERATGVDDSSRSPSGNRARDELDGRVLAAAQAAIPPGLLARIKAAETMPRAKSAGGRVGALRSGRGRGRPAGTRPGAPSGNARLNVIETLRAAAPWQRLRGRGVPREGAAAKGEGRVRIEAADFRVTRFKLRARTLTIFAVDASGSSALHRLAEAKGAVELLLADCYIRRDQVAVISFRGRSAELLLPPTRSLVRAKRGLAGLPGGGGTPLAAAIDSAAALAAQAQRRGETPTLVLLTDGNANVDRRGAPGREAAHRDALLAARAVRLANIDALLIDTSQRPHVLASEIAAAMHARYVPLPHANSRDLSDIVKAASTTGT